LAFLTSTSKREKEIGHERVWTALERIQFGLSVLSHSHRI
jgi:hypothetical protein